MKSKPVVCPPENRLLKNNFQNPQNHSLNSFNTSWGYFPRISYEGWNTLATNWRISNKRKCSISERRLKRKDLILCGYLNAFCGHSSPRHLMEEYLILPYQSNTRVYLIPWRRSRT